MHYFSSLMWGLQILLFGLQGKFVLMEDDATWWETMKQTLKWILLTHHFTTSLDQKLHPKLRNSWHTLFFPFRESEQQWFSALRTLVSLMLDHVVSRGVKRSAASSYAAMHMVAGSRPVFVIAWEWHIGLALVCGCSGALEYPTTNSWRPINKSLSLSLSLWLTSGKET